MNQADQLKQEIHKKVAEYYALVHDQKDKNFIPKQSKIGYAGRVFDINELTNLVDASLDFWLTAGPWAELFEKKFAEKIGVRFARLVNSGSSANLLAFMALTSPLLKDRQLQRGDEVITVAAGFPTTVAPIVQYGAIPVFVDITLDDGTYNIDCSALKDALSPKTKAVMLAHTLGNPFRINEIVAFCKKHNLWLIEDNCDALGSRFEEQLTGTFGDIATSSFYPPHHITMGEGGAVYTQQPYLMRILESLRDWGRDCWCPSGHDNTCNKRFGWQLGTLPKGYDHKYTYSHFGYNLKATDMQAAIGCAQLDKLDLFTESRRNNWSYLYNGLKDLSEQLILPQPTPGTKPSWFGFLITLRKDAGITRDKMVRDLEENGIQTRMLFAGNLTHHPCFDQMKKEKKGYRAIGNLANTDRVMHDSFWVGVYPGLTNQMLDFMIQQIRTRLRS